MMTSSHLTEHLAEYAARAEQPPAARSSLALLAADYLTLAVAGARTPSGRAAALALDAGESGGSRVETTGGSAPAEGAALVNGIAAHGSELDDTHEESSSHPGVVVWPAVLAIADTLPVSYDEVVEAAGAGYDVMTSTGVLIGASETYSRGFHPTGIAGALGAAAAVARLLRLDPPATRDAIALAADMAAGSLQFLADGSWTKRLNAGHAAAVGVRAARLAARGFEGPHDALDGDHGWLRLYGSGEPAAEFALSPGAGALATSVKFYACCRYMHGVMDLLTEVRAAHPGLRPAQVARIDAAVIEAGQTLVSVPAGRKLRINSGVDAQFSMPFGAALALETGGGRLADFNDAVALAPGLQEWMTRVRSVTSPRVEAAYPAAWTAEVTLSFADGRVAELREEAFRGSPQRPASAADIREKATELLGPTGALIVEIVSTSEFGATWMDVRRNLDDAVLDVRSL